MNQNVVKFMDLLIDQIDTNEFTKHVLKTAIRDERILGKISLSQNDLKKIEKILSTKKDTSLKNPQAILLGQKIYRTLVSELSQRDAA